MLTKYLKIIGMIMFLASCASLPTPEIMKAEIKDYDLPAKATDSEALIYVLRPSSIGGLVRFNVFLDDKDDSSEMGWTRAKQYIYFYVKPGEHFIHSKAENWATKIINVKAGETVFIKQDVDMGFIMARNNFSDLTSDEGKYFVKTTKQGTIKKTRK